MRSRLSPHPARLRWTALLAALLLPPLQGVGAQSVQAAPAPAPAPASAPGPGAVPTSTDTLQPVVLKAPDVQQVSPGDYATLIFRADGQGEYDMTVDAAADPAGQAWVPVSSQRTVLLAGPTLVPVTFRVPPRAAVGASPTVTMRLSPHVSSRPGTTPAVAQATTHLDVRPQARLTVRAPDQLTGQPRRKVTFEVQFTNQGNQDDTVDLRVVNVDQRPQLSTPTLQLRPGETRAVGVSLSIDDASPGYEYLVAIEVRSHNDPALHLRSRTDIVFNPATVLGTARSDQPQLVFGVSSGIDTGIDWTPQGQQTYFRYGVQPSLGGQLSDYATGQSSLSGLSGRAGQLRPQGLNVALRLTARHWDLLASGGQTGLSLSGNVYRGAWTLSPRASVARLRAGALDLRGGLGLSGPVLGGVLDTDISTAYSRADSGSARADQLSVRYDRRLSPRLGLVVGGVASGVQTSGDPANPGYRVSGVGFEQVTYTGDRIDVTQAYSGTPTGLHNFSVSGGLSDVRPLGLRAALSAAYQPQGVTYTGSGVVGYAAGNGLGLSVSGRYQNGTVPGTVPTWSVTGSLRSPTLSWGQRAVLSSAVAYTLNTDADQPGHYGWTLVGNAGLITGPLRTSASARWSRDPQPGSDTLQDLRLGLSGTYQLRASDTLGAEYSYDQQRGLQGATSQDSTTSALRATWTHQWTPRIDTAVEYGRSWTTTPTSSASPERLGLSVGVQDALLHGLGARVGYVVAAPDGLTHGGLSSGVHLSLNYGLAWTVNTPQVLTKLFGGRRGGEVRGVLYRDDNYNGRRDPGEPGLAGVSIQMGTARTTSGPDGSYSLRVPVGTFAMAYVGGLPATLESLTDDTLTIKENSVTPLDVPFAPVVRSEVLVYDDTNHNGQRDPGEETLPYVGVSFSGPVTRLAQGDNSGVARLSALPPGTYAVSLNPAQLPEGYVATGSSVQATLRLGEHPGPIELGAALPAKQNVSTFTAGTIALIGTLSSDTVLAGQPMQVTLRVQRATGLRIEAFGQTFTPAISGGKATQTLAVPPTLAPGTYDIVATASQGTEHKATTLQLIVLTPAQAAGTAPTSP